MSKKICGFTSRKWLCFFTMGRPNTAILDFRSARQIPTLTDQYGVSTSEKIIVPDELYESWITADIWKKAASVIVKASEA